VRRPVAGRRGLDRTHALCPLWIDGELVDLEDLVLHGAGADIRSPTHELTIVNLGLKSIAVERRRHRARDTRLLAVVNAIIAAAELGLKEHDRLALARTMMDRKLAGRRASSKLPELINLVMARPLVSAGMVAETLEVTPRAALRIIEELGPREMIGRGRFRAWGLS
jgi:hypothetical protein